MRLARRRARLEAVLDYIDSHYGEPLDVDFLAGLARISAFHFQRLFTAHVGETASAYVRRRALERAARALRLEGASVTGCALEAGYAGASAFSRAFHRQFGVSPRAMRRQARVDSLVCAVPVEGRSGIRTLPSLHLLAVRRWGAAERVWAEAWQSLERVLAERQAPPTPVLRIGVPSDGSDLVRMERRRYEACVLVDAAAGGETFRRHLPGGDYAVFDYHGPLAGLQAAHDAVLWQAGALAGMAWRPGPALHLLSQPLAEAQATTTVEAEILLPVRRLPRSTRRPAADPVRGDRPANSARTG